VHPAGQIGGSGNKDAPQLYLSEQLYMSQAIVTLSARPDGLFPLPGKESNNTRAGGIKAYSTADRSTIAAVLLYRRPAAATAWPLLKDGLLLIAGGSLDRSRLC